MEGISDIEGFNDVLVKYPVCDVVAKVLTEGQTSNFTTDDGTMYSLEEFTCVGKDTAEITRGLQKHYDRVLDALESVHGVGVKHRLIVLARQHELQDVKDHAGTVFKTGCFGLMVLPAEHGIKEVEMKAFA